MQWMVLSMMWIRRLVYRAGLRPKYGSIFYSPSLSFIAWIDKIEKESR